MHILNSTNYRRHNTKISYQQICNWFSNARATQRQKSQRLEGDLSTLLAAPIAGQMSLQLNEILQKQRELSEAMQVENNNNNGNGHLVNGEMMKQEEESVEMHDHMQPLMIASEDGMHEGADELAAHQLTLDTHDSPFESKSTGNKYRNCSESIF